MRGPAELHCPSGAPAQPADPEFKMDAALVIGFRAWPFAPSGNESLRHSGAPPQAASPESLIINAAEYGFQARR